MASTRWAYVKTYELPDPVLPNTYMVIRLDGQSFHKFSDAHGFAKPNDVRALELMDRAALSVMEKFPDIVLAFGESDEYSFLLKKSCSLFKRRQSKILTSITSLFTSSYVFLWSQLLPDTPLQYPPTFDGRLVIYPSDQEVLDYFAWRQADTHINNLYNTTFWALIQQGGLTTAQAHEKLRGTVSNQKNEILFSQFGINYNDIDARFRKGSILVWESPSSNQTGQELPHGSSIVEDSLSPPIENPRDVEESDAESGVTKVVTSDATSKADIQTRLKKKSKKALEKQARKERTVRVLHCDIINKAFWDEHQDILS